MLWNVVEEMTIAAGLPKMPDVYIIDKDALNAFATGRGPDRASIAVTSGLLETLDRDELQGVVAHELGHVKNRDVLYLLLLGAMAGAIVILADVGRRVLWYGPPRRRTSDKGNPLGAVIMIAAVLLIVLAPLLAHLLQLAVSRRREYLADACGAQFTRYPDGLAGALEKIGREGGVLKDVPRTVAPSFISDPLAKASLDEEGASAWGSTHPPLTERIRILRAMGGMPGYARYDEAFRTVTRRPVGVMPASALAEAMTPCATPNPTRARGPTACAAPPTRYGRPRTTPSSRARAGRRSSSPRRGPGGRSRARTAGRPTWRARDRADPRGRRASAEQGVIARPASRTHFRDDRPAGATHPPGTGPASSRPAP